MMDDGKIIHKLYTEVQRAAAGIHEGSRLQAAGTLFVVLVIAKFSRSRQVVCAEVDRRTKLFGNRADALLSVTDDLTRGRWTPREDGEDES